MTEIVSDMPAQQPERTRGLYGQTEVVVRALGAAGTDHLALALKGLGDAKIGNPSGAEFYSNLEDSWKGLGNQLSGPEALGVDSTGKSGQQ